GVANPRAQSRSVGRSGPGGCPDSPGHRICLLWPILARAKPGNPSQSEKKARLTAEKIRGAKSLRHRQKREIFAGRERERRGRCDAKPWSHDRDFAALKRA